MSFLRGVFVLLLIFVTSVSPIFSSQTEVEYARPRPLAVENVDGHTFRSRRDTTAIPRALYLAGLLGFAGSLLYGSTRIDSPWNRIGSVSVGTVSLGVLFLADYLATQQGQTDPDSDTHD